MYPEVGQFFLAMSVVSSFLGAAILLRPSLMLLITLNQRALTFSCLLLLGAMLMLITGFVEQDTSLLLVANSSHFTLPTLYKITSSWGNHEGSLLLFILILSIVSFILGHWTRLKKSVHGVLVLGIASLLSCFFSLFCFFLANPFLRLNPYPEAGQGFNPILQDPFLALHPPILYLGYAGLAIAFCFAMALLWRPVSVRKWARLLQPWVMMSWTALLAGIALGAFWAYRELGWGGYWFWDPVESASLMPWLIATALIHVLILVEKRNLMVGWCVLLAIIGLSFCLIAFFIVRSGMLVSVHSFASSPERGIGLVILFATTVIISTLVFAWRAKHFVRPIDFHPISRETLLVIGSLLFLVSALLILLGVFYPLLSILLFDQEVSVGATWYNAVVAPIFLVIVVLAFITPLVSWRFPRLLVPAPRLFLSLGAAFILSILCFYGLGNQTLSGFALTLGLCFSLALVIQDFWQRQPWQRTARVLAHGSLAIIVPAVMASFLFSSESAHTIPLPRSFMLAEQGEDPFSRQEVFATNSTEVQVGDTTYSISLQKLREARKSNYVSSTLELELQTPKRTLTMEPERRRYVPEAIETSEAAQNTHWQGDIQINIERLPYRLLNEEPATEISLRIIKKAYVVWIWIAIGGALFGGLIAVNRYFRRLSRQDSDPGFHV